LLGFGNTSTEGSIRNHLVEVKTGEGKSLILAVAITVFAFLGFDVYAACYSKHLINRDYNEFKELFELLSISKKIHYGTIEELCETVIN